MFKQHCDALWSEALNLQKLESGWGIPFQKLIVLFKRAAIAYLDKYRRDTFADTRNVGDLPLRVTQDVENTFGVTLDCRCRVSIAPDSEPVLRRDLHQIRSLIQHPRDFPIT